MKKLISFLLCFNTILISYSQELIINDSITLKRGIYLDFLDFKYNSPSIPLQSEIWSYSRRYGFFNPADKIDYYFIEIHSKIVKEIGKVYGFCDGQNVYISSNIATGDFEYGFVKIDNLGPYCYFEDRNISVTQNDPVKLNANNIGLKDRSIFTKQNDLFKFNTNNIGPALPSASIRLSRNVIDFNTGKIIELNKDNIFDLISSDKKLTEKFSTLKRKKKNLKKCITYYNQRQKKEFLKQQSGFNLQNEYNQHELLIDLILNQTILFKTKKESFSDYSSRMLGYMNYASFRTINKVEKYYKNGNLKYCGFESQHLIGSNGKQVFKIGTWTYYDKSGNERKVVNYNLWGIEVDN